MSSNSFPNHLFSLDKYKLIELLMETQEKLEENSVKCLQIEKDLKISKDYVSYSLRSFKFVQFEFFILIKKNRIFYYSGYYFN